MDLYLKNTTFVIVCFKSQKVIYDCLNTLPKEANKIIVENSNNLNLKKDLESKFNNIECSKIRCQVAGFSPAYGREIFKVAKTSVGRIPISWHCRSASVLPFCEVAWCENIPRHVYFGLRYSCE